QLSVAGSSTKRILLPMPSSMLQVSKLGKMYGAYGMGMDISSQIVNAFQYRMTPRDSEAVRRISSIYRYFNKFTTSPNWQPYYPTVQNGVYASFFPLGNENFWTLVNRRPDNLTGIQINVPFQQGYYYYDVYHGVALTPQPDGKGMRN